jgi:hypothetical protein
MQCRQCQKFLPRGVAYCAYCGAAIKPTFQRRIVAGVGALLSVALVVVGGYLFQSYSQGSASGSPTSLAAVSTSVSQPPVEATSLVETSAALASTPGSSLALIITSTPNVAATQQAQTQATELTQATTHAAVITTSALSRVTTDAATAAALEQATAEALERATAVVVAQHVTATAKAQIAAQATRQANAAARAARQAQAARETEQAQSSTPLSLDGDWFNTSSDHKVHLRFVVRNNRIVWFLGGPDGGNCFVRLDNISVSVIDNSFVIQGSDNKGQNLDLSGRFTSNDAASGRIKIVDSAGNICIDTRWTTYMTTPNNTSVCDGGGASCGN